VRYESKGIEHHTTLKYLKAERTTLQKNVKKTKKYSVQLWIN